MEISSHIWDGEDYIPYVWEEWLKDDQGLLAVAQYHQRVIGFGKLTQLTLDDWWLEGLRVHPEYEGRGVASQLNDYLVNYWGRHYRGTIRLATSSERVRIHHLCQRNGFKRVGEITSYKAGVLGEEKHHFHPIKTDEIEDVYHFIIHSSVLYLSYGLMDLGWQWAAPSVSLIEKAVENKRALWWHNPAGQPKGLILYWGNDWDSLENRKKPVPMISLIICPPDELKDCLIDYRKYGAGLSYEQVGWLVPVQPAFLKALEAAGYRRDWDGSLYLFAKSMPASGD
jgi:GNAT superfamily N-acetyltransferase